MKIISLIVILTFLSGPISARADQPQLKIKLPTVSSPATETDLGAVISPLLKSQKAPFSGILLSPRAVAEIITEISSYEDAVSIERDKLVKEHAANLDRELLNQRLEHDTEKSILTSRLASSDKQVIDLGAQLEKEIRNRPNVPMWTSLGVLGGIGITLLTMFAIQASN